MTGLLQHNPKGHIMSQTPQAQQPNPNYHVVWAEIPVTDLEAARQFYGAVMKAELSIFREGPNPMVFFPREDQSGGHSAHIYEGTPAPAGVGPTIHLLTPDDLEATADRVVEAGGKVLSPPIEIPEGSFIYTTDPDGNSIGWWQPKAA